MGAVLPWPNPPYNPVNVSFSTSGNQTLIAAPSAGGVGIFGLILVNAGVSATTINFYQDGVGVTSVGSIYLAAGGGSGGFSLILSPKSPYFLTNALQPFIINSSAAVQVNGIIYAAICP